MGEVGSLTPAPTFLLQPLSNIGELMDLKILVDSEEFLTALLADLRVARRHVYVQTLSFEADDAGTALADGLLACQAPDRRLLVDAFTQYIINDRFLYHPRNRRDPALMAEARATSGLVDRLRTHDVPVRFTNPAGLFLRKFAARNHKKLVVLDDSVAYLGGINFSDHNFAWHDMMLRIEHDGVAAFLKEDFSLTWVGTNRPASQSFGDVELHSFDGSTNESAFAPLLQRIDEARSSIFVQSPYVSFPFLTRLREAAQRGVAVTLLGPEENNRRSLQKYITWEAARSGIRLRLYPDRMTHLKAMLVDDEALVLGSTNFGYLSYTLHQELAAVVTDPTVIRTFKTRIQEPDLASAVGPNAAAGAVSGYLRYGALRSLGWAVATLAR